LGALGRLDRAEQVGSNFQGPITPEAVIPKVENQPRSPALMPANGPYTLILAIVPPCAGECRLVLRVTVSTACWSSPAPELVLLLCWSQARHHRRADIPSEGLKMSRHRQP